MYRPYPFDRGRESANLEDDGLVAASSRWFRHSRYEIVLKDGLRYIRPAKGATVEYYRPLKHSEALDSYLDLANSLEQHASAEGLDETTRGQVKKRTADLNAEKILSFCNQFGLIGDLWESASSWNTVRRTVFVAETPYDQLFPGRRHGEIPIDEFVSRYLCGPLKGLDVKHCLGRQQPFIDKYAEWVGLIETDALGLLHIARELDRFRSGEFLPDSRWTMEDGSAAGNVTWRQHLDILEAPNVALRLAFGVDGAQIDYSFQSLSSALRIMFVLDSVSKEQRILMCPGCRKPFRTGNKLKQYCSVACSLKIRKTKYRKRQKAKKGGK